MRMIVIGAVAAGTSAAAKARRNDEELEIVVYDQDRYISYSGCGMPYVLGGLVKDPLSLAPRDPAFFRDKYNVEVRIRHRILGIDVEKKTVGVRNLETGEEFTDRWDILVLATGARPVFPPFGGISRADVIGLRNLNDLLDIDRWIREQDPKQVVIIGTGFIGMEVCENLTHRGLKVTMLEKEPQVNPGLDEDVAAYVEEHLHQQGIDVFLGTTVQSIDDRGVVLSDNRVLPSDLTILATGVRPETTLAREAGIALGVTGGVRTDHSMQTNVPGVYACGDCVELTDRVTGEPVYAPLGSTANKTGRVAGDAATGGTMTFPGILGTSIYRVFDRTVARTGLTETQARKMGIDVIFCHNTKPDRPGYMGGREMLIKAVAEARTGRLLGAQIVGEEGVDKRIDVLATALAANMTADDLMHLDLAYAPPFSTTKDPVIYTGMILDGQKRTRQPLGTVESLEDMRQKGQEHLVIDARKKDQYEAGHIPGAINLDPQALRRKLTEQPDAWSREAPVFTYCNKGVTGNAAYNILRAHGFTLASNLSGGYRHYSTQIRRAKKQNER